RLPVRSAIAGARSAACLLLRQCSRKAAIPYLAHDPAGLTYGVAVCQLSGRVPESAGPGGEGRGMGRIEAAFAEANRVLVALALAATFLIVFLNVVLRYGFGSSLSWAEE